MTRQKKLTFFTASYSQAAVVFPSSWSARPISPKLMQLGGLMQTANAFGQRAERAVVLHHRCIATSPNGAR